MLVEVNNRGGNPGSFFFLAGCPSFQIEDIKNLMIEETLKPTSAEHLWIIIKSHTPVDFLSLLHKPAFTEFTRVDYLPQLPNGELDMALINMILRFDNLLMLQHNKDFPWNWKMNAENGGLPEWHWPDIMQLFRRRNLPLM